MHPHSQTPTPPANDGRRAFLKWLTNGLGAAFAATLGVPAALYLFDPRNRPAPIGDFKPVAKLSELKEGVPFEAVIHEIRRDAWTLHPNDIVGKVWMIRRGDEVKVLSTTCPHLGCSVNFEGGKFVCPCHNGTYTLDGVRTDPGADRTNPAPRDMDTLEYKIEPDPENPKDKIIFVHYQSFKPNEPTKELRS
jgi:menaquinol-cytochrome c reductase iron-sulfur subunit